MNDETNIRHLRTPQTQAATMQPNERMISCLEGLLALAKEGKLRAFTFVGVHQGNAIQGSDTHAPILPTNGEGYLPTLGDCRSVLASLLLLQAKIVESLRKEENNS